MQGPDRTDAAPKEPTPPEAGTNSYRFRLVGAMALVLEEKGYAAATIADIARHAHVSKRTFYEVFPDKEACFIACYEALSDLALEAVKDAMTRKGPWEKRMRASTKAYLGFLEAHPTLTRTLMMDIYAAGPEAMKVRRTVMMRFADNLRNIVEQGRAENPEIAKLSLETAAAVIGGIHELVLLAVEQGRADRLTELAPTADALLRAVTSSG